MSYSIIAKELILNTSWESYPYSSSLSTGDLHYFKRPGEWTFYCQSDIPHTYVQLNIRKRLKELYPEKCPNMDTVGYAVRQVLSELEIGEYYSAEDRGWELSDYWATLEAVYISGSKYEHNILSKIEKVTKSTFGNEKDQD